LADVTVGPAPPVHRAPPPPAAALGVAAVVPTFERPALLRRAVESVLGQTRRPAELVVVDVGGRSWSSALDELIDSSDIPFLRLVLRAPAHAGRARNAGAALASAPVLAFLDDDDVWAPEYLAQAVQVLSGARDSLVVTPLLVRHEGSVLMLPRLPPVLRARDVLARNPGVTGTNVVLRRELLASVGGYDERLAAFNDLDLLVRLLDEGIAVAQADEPLAEQFLHEAGQISEPSPRRLAALELYATKHGRRMSGTQRRYLARERHWMQSRLAEGWTHRFGHRLMQLLLTSPVELVRVLRRRRALGLQRQHSDSSVAAP
jgi:glycosyltransferase involved in cell wall biosynthesis